MRRIFLLALVLGIGYFGLNAQTWYETTLDGNTYRNGNVGIGVTTPTNGKLHIYRNATTGGWGSIITSNAGLRIQDNAANMYIDGNTIYSDQNMNFGSIGNAPITFGTNNLERLRINENGKVGIGITVPIGILSIYSETTIGTPANYANSQIYLTNNSNQKMGIDPNQIYSNADLNIQTSAANIIFYTNDTEKMIINSDGNLGIGTTTPTNKLDVNGTIHTKEVKVDMNGWSDFVFHPTYNLRPLQEVNTFIQQNGHLPEIPTAKEVEENGVSLGEMNAKLLQKIEELTLYTIEQEKRIEKLEEIIKKLQ